MRSDVAVKIFGDDLDVLLREANEVAAVVGKVRGAADVKVQQLAGLPVLQVRIDRAAIARCGINVADVQEVSHSAIAGTEATTVLEGFMRFGLVVRFPPDVRSDPTRQPSPTCSSRRRPENAYRCRRSPGSRVGRAQPRSRAKTASAASR